MSQLKTILFTAVVFTLSGLSVAFAGAKLINVQGTMTDSADNPLSGTQSITFRLYENLSDPVSSNIWNVTRGILFTNGQYSLSLGEETSLDTLSFDKTYYLGIQVSGDPNELSPRKVLGASSYALGSPGDFEVKEDMSVMGNVGIGTNSPLRKLHLLGPSGSVSTFPSIGGLDFLVLENNGNTNIGLIAGSSSSSEIKFYKSGDVGISGALSYNFANDHMSFATGQAERARIDSSGNVGIGTTSPGAKLDVAGDLCITGSSAETVRPAGIQNVNNHTVIWYGNGVGNLYFKSGATGVTGDKASIASNGQIWSAVGGFLSGSSRKLKKNIKDSSYGLKTIKALRPKKYKLKSDKMGRNHLGLIAEEAGALVPEAMGIATLSDGTKVMGLNYQKFIPVLIKAVQDLSAENEALKKRVQAIEKQLP